MAHRNSLDDDDVEEEEQQEVVEEEEDDYGCYCEYFIPAYFLYNIFDYLFCQF